MKCRVAALLFLFMSGAARAESVARVLSGDEMVVDDGRTLRIASIEAAAPDAKNFVEKITAGHALTLQDAATDRYGRIAATVLVEGQSQSLQMLLLAAAMGFVYPTLGNEPHLDEMLAAENTARAARLGWWADHADTPADEAGKLIGSYGFVVGTVVKSERVKNKLYLNFGPDWHTAFTVEIAARDLRAFKNAGINLLGWQGKRLRVRGWVKHQFGPRMTVTDPHQIEVVP